MGQVTVSALHVRGAVRAYRWRCFEDVSPIEAKLGWDTVDELKAHLAGWRTGTIDGITFRHHRGLGARDGRRWERARRQGHASHYLGYRSWYLVMRAIRRSLDDPAALAMLWGYCEAAWGRETRHPDEAVRRELRRRQSLRQLPARLTERCEAGIGVWAVGGAAHNRRADGAHHLATWLGSARASVRSSRRWSAASVLPSSLHDNARQSRALSEREAQVMQLMTEGMTNRQIAGRLSVTVHAVKFHLASIYRKLEVHNRTEAAVTFLAENDALKTPP